MNQPHVIIRPNPHNPCAHLTPEQRLDRIAELLAKAAGRYWHQVELGLIPSPEAPADAERKPAQDDESRILRHILQEGSASPRELCVALGLPRSTLGRKLDLLVKSGRLIAAGMTRRVRYSPGPALRH